MQTLAQPHTNGNTNGFAWTQTTPPLAEAPCSVNGYFQVDGFTRDFQATGRGFTPAEAAANLANTIRETRAALAPPAPVVVPVPNREAQVAQLLACGIAKATARNDWQRIERLAKAATLVLSGAVELCAMGGMYTVKSQARPDQVYDVSCTGVCACQGYQRHASTTEGYWCKHGLAVLMAVRLGESEMA